MKIFKIPLATFVLTALLFSAWALPAEAETSPVYLALGDSISTGYKLSGGHFKEENYTNILAKANGYSLKNCAVDGNTADGILKQLQKNSLKSTVEKAKIVTVTCGGNDMVNALLDEAITAYNTLNTQNPLKRSELLKIFKNPKDERYRPLLLATGFILSDFQKSDRFQNTLAHFELTLSDIVKTIRALNPNAVIFVATQYNPYGHFTGEYKEILCEPAKECTVLLNDCIKKLSESSDFEAVDVYSAFLNNEALLCNASEDPIQLDFHPSREGHEVIAACFQKAIDKTVFPTGELKKASAGIQKQKQNDAAIYGALFAGSAAAAAVLILRIRIAKKAAEHD